MNSLRSAWTPFLAGPTDSLRQAKGETQARYSQPSVEIYSLADWYKIPVRSLRWRKVRLELGLAPWADRWSLDTFFSGLQSHCLPSDSLDVCSLQLYSQSSF